MASSKHFNVKEHTITASHFREYYQATANSQEESLQLCIKQYTAKNNPDPNPGDVTLIGFHASGQVKELYEPVWDDLCEALSRNDSTKIRSIWIADVASQGASGVLNASKLGNDLVPDTLFDSYYDSSRDVFHMINHFRKDMPQPLVGVAHSSGTAALINLSLFHPRLFTTVILLEPMLQPHFYPPNLGPKMAFASMARPDTFPSPTAAYKFFTRAFSRTYDPRTLSLYLRYGLRPVDPSIPDGKVTLTTTKYQEVLSMARPSVSAVDPTTKVFRVDRSKHPDLDPDALPVWPTYRPEVVAMWKALPAVRPLVLYVFGGRSPLATPKYRKAKMDRTGVGVGGSGGEKEGRVKEVVVEGGSHLVPLEKPKICAEIMALWLESEMGRWRLEESMRKEEWENVSKEDKGLWPAGLLEEVKNASFSMAGVRVPEYRGELPLPDGMMMRDGFWEEAEKGRGSKL